MTDVEISVLIPVKNYAAYIEDAICSAVYQKQVRVEVVIQDCMSDDGTRDIVEEYVRAGFSIIYHREHDAGQSDALNRALLRARGYWIAWLNADEFYCSEFALFKLMRTAVRYRADVAYGDALFVDESGRVLRRKAAHPFDDRCLAGYGPFVQSCSALFRRDPLSSVRWDPNFRVIMDLRLYLGLAARGAVFKWVPEPIGAFRVHDTRVTADPTASRPEWELLRRQGLVPRSKLAFVEARVRHWLWKGLTGGYVREAVTLIRDSGRDIRWFRGGAVRAWSGAGEAF